MIHRLEHPDRVTVGAIGEVGSRLFLLQAREGRRLVVVKVEKDQIAILASWLARVVREMARPGHLEVDVELEAEYEVDLVAGEITVGIDEEAETIEVTIEVRRGGRRHPGRDADEGAGRRLRDPRRPADRGGPAPVPVVCASRSILADTTVRGRTDTARPSGDRAPHRAGRPRS